MHMLKEEILQLWVGHLNRFFFQSPFTQVIEIKLSGGLLCCCCSITQLCLTPRRAARQASLSFTISQRLLKLMSIQPSHPLSPTSLAFNLSSIRVFSSESALCNRWPKYWSFSFSISSSNKYPGLSSLRIDCFDLLTVYETLKSLLQYHSSKASIIFYLNLFILIGA